MIHFGWVRQESFLQNTRRLVIEGLKATPFRLAKVNFLYCSRWQISSRTTPRKSAPFPLWQVLTRQTKWDVLQCVQVIGLVDYAMAKDTKKHFEKMVNCCLRQVTTAVFIHCIPITTISENRSEVSWNAPTEIVEICQNQIIISLISTTRGKKNWQITEAFVLRENVRIAVSTTVMVSRR